MTKLANEIIKCCHCGKESEQLVVYSVNFLLGNKEENERLLKHKQKCPFCGYEEERIDTKQTEESI